MFKIWASMFKIGPTVVHCIWKNVLISDHKNLTPLLVRFDNGMEWIEYIFLFTALRYKIKDIQM
jgi:hypothetical protein